MLAAAKLAGVPQEGLLPTAVRVPLAVVEDGARRLALATTVISGIVDHGEFFTELRPCATAFDQVAAGHVPLLVAHYSDHWRVDHQLGAVRESRSSSDGNSVELLVEFGHNPVAEWIWRDLCAGLPFGCSIGFALYGHIRTLPPAPLSKPYYVTPEWMLKELTVLGAGCGQDSSAKIIRPQNVAELLDEMRVLREVREESARRALPSWHADPLRGRLPAIAAAIAADTGGDAQAIELSLAREIEAYIADAVPR